MSTKMRSSKPGRPTSGSERLAMDPIKAMIILEGPCVAVAHPYKELDLFAIVLNSGDILQSRISDFERLRKASAHN